MSIVTKFKEITVLDEKVTVNFNTDSGRFSVNLKGNIYTSTSYPALLKKIKSVAIKKTNFGPVKFILKLVITKVSDTKISYTLEDISEILSNKPAKFAEIVSNYSKTFKVVDTDDINYSMGNISFIHIFEKSSILISTNLISIDSRGKFHDFHLRTYYITSKDFKKENIEEYLKVYLDDRNLAVEALNK
jgi:hypothetical protein